MEDDGWEAEDVSLATSVSVPPVEKCSEFRGWLSVVSSYSSGDHLLYTEVQYMFTLICMRYLYVCLIH